MTDRINSFTVVLDHDIRDDDLDPILNAVRCLRHVLSVTPHVTKITDHVAAERIRREYRHQLLEAIDRIDQRWGPSR